MLRPLEASPGCSAFVPAFSGALGQLSSREAGQAAVERLFRRLLAEPGLAEALNATCPETTAAKLIYKAEGREHLGHAQDRKCTIDLNKRKLEASRGFFAQQLGDDGLLALRFCDELMGSVAPAALQGLAAREDFGQGLLRFHESGDFAVRFLFYPEHKARGSQGIRCGEHVDSSTCTLILQDSTGGLQVKHRGEGEWRDVSEPLLLMVGCVGDILTNHRVQALLHRVVDVPPVAARGLNVIPQRLSTVVFLDCDPEKRLEPLVMAPGEPPHFKAGLTKGEVKAAITNFNFCREPAASATAAALLSSPEEGSTAILQGLVIR